MPVLALAYFWGKNDTIFLSSPEQKSDGME